VRVVDELLGLVSASGAQAEGRVYEIPMDAAEILADPVRAMEYVEQATQMAADWGAKVVGLGSMTGVIGGQGVYLAERASIPVTTGNSLTIYAALQNLYRACAEADLDLRHETVAVIGVPGSISTAAATILAAQCKKLLLVARRSSSRADQIASELGAELCLDIPTALDRSRIVFSATSAGNCIDQRLLRPGSLVIDVAVPTDVQGGYALRQDTLIISGGLSRVPATMPQDSMFLGFHHGTIPSCLGETIVLALEERSECYSLGRNLDVDRIMEIGATAVSHGYDFSKLHSFGLELEPSTLAHYRKAAHRRRREALRSYRNGRANGKAGRNGKAISASAPPQAEALGQRAAQLYERYINPVLIALSSKGGFAKTFVRGEGNFVWDSSGRRYLDLVAGFGSLNLGHNHPQVTAGIQAALAEQAPGFVQSAVNPWAAALAEQLVAVSPVGLEMVFFANSGTEAVEAALKLARIVTGRSGLLHCERSYHGKSLGALSVTGNPHYQKPFGPLLPDCEAVRFGDLEALERALTKRRFAAFIVEPIQAEGGMIVPPEGYLKRAQELCQATDTLFIVDEVQTGMGRTGEMFAVDHEGLTPDAMTVAKSLGGGLMPIGAMICRRDLWLKAYGSIDTFALHTSTFGGGSLACAAGLATIKTLESEHLLEQAAARGEQLYRGLADLCERCDLVREVRGRGLLLGLEFNPLPPTLVTHWRQTQSQGLSQYLMPQATQLIESLPSMYVMHNLLEEFGIYTQVARSNPLVLRIQPPLTISFEQVKEVLAAIEQVCFELDHSNKMVEIVIAKSTTGEHRPDNAVTIKSNEVIRCEPAGP
jgi:acetylornithine/succinyldiaminopimelate/putrescine aminotransferase/predicted amino acid dehydrogenase